MAEHPLTLLLFGLLTACAIVITVALLSVIADTKRFLQQVNVLLPGADRTLREANRSLGHARRILLRADDAARLMGSMVVRTCAIWSGALEQVAELRDKAARLFTSGLRNGNGVRAEPRLRRGRK